MSERVSIHPSWGMDRSEPCSSARFQRIVEIEPMIAQCQGNELSPGHHTISAARTFQILARSFDADPEDYADFPIALPGGYQA